MSHTRSKECPKCGGMSHNSGHGGGQAYHHMQHARHFGPLIGCLGLLHFCSEMYKSVRFTCQRCGHKFFG